MADWLRPWADAASSAHAVEWAGAVAWWRQMALSLVLVTTALLFAGGLRKLRMQDPGFRADGVVIVMADISGAKMAAAQRKPYFLQLLDRLQSSGGVVAAASVAGARLSAGWTWNSPVSVEGARAGSSTEGEAGIGRGHAGILPRHECSTDCRPELQRERRRALTQSSDCESDVRSKVPGRRESAGPLLPAHRRIGGCRI